MVPARSDIGVGEVAMRLRESTHTIVKALAVLKQQGRAEETHVRGTMAATSLRACGAGTRQPGV
jgi:hypothetical protein